MILQLSQNELMKIPRDREQHIDIDGNIIPATSEVYFWLPLKRYSNTKQIIWVDVDTYDDGLETTIPTYIDDDNNEIEMDYRSQLSNEMLNYLDNTDWYIVRKFENGTEVPQTILDNRALCRLNIGS